MRRPFAFLFVTALVSLPYAVLATSAGCSDAKMPDVLGDPPNPDTGTGKMDAGPDVIKPNPEAGACDDLPLGGYINQSVSTGAAPAPAGGTIVDGFYILTAAKLYGSGSTETFAQSLLIQNGTMHFTKLIKGDTMKENVYGVYGVDPDAGPTQVSVLFTSCADGGIVVTDGGSAKIFGFTATATQFDLQGTVAAGTIVDQFTKQ